MTDVDRSEWPSGPWDDEPDHLEWRSQGLPCLMHRGHLGNWCGYVAVTKGHPLYGADHDTDATYALDVHGGITYAERCQGRICHVPREGESDDVWWLGFDCLHAYDLTPGVLALRQRLSLGPYPEETYRDERYVRAEVEGLARQLAEMAR